MTAEPRRRYRQPRAIHDLATHDETFLRISQVATYLQVDRRTVVDKYIAGGYLEAIKLPGGHMRVPTASLRAFVDTMRLRPPA